MRHWEGSSGPPEVTRGVVSVLEVWVQRSWSAMNANVTKALNIRSVLS